MHRPTEVARWYKRIDPRRSSTRTSPYTGDEVRELPTSVAPRRPDRAERARGVAAIPGQWLGYLAARLPSLVYFHTSGVGRLPSWHHEAALDLAYACIARRLNATQR